VLSGEHVEVEQVCAVADLVEITYSIAGLDISESSEEAAALGRGAQRSARCCSVVEPCKACGGRGVVTPIWRQQLLAKNEGKRQ